MHPEHKRRFIQCWFTFAPQLLVYCWVSGVDCGQTLNQHYWVDALNVPSIFAADKETVEFLARPNAERRKLVLLSMIDFSICHV